MALRVQDPTIEQKMGYARNSLVRTGNRIGERLEGQNTTLYARYQRSLTGI